MKKYFLLQPRQSGKTTKALYEYSKDPENTIFVAFNRDNADRACKSIGGDRKRFLTAERFMYSMRGYHIKNIILDEYMFFPNKKEIYDTIHIHNPENVYIFSTSNKMYDEVLFKLIKHLKVRMSLQSIIDLIKDILKTPLLANGVIDELNELYYNFLTDPDTILIDHFDKRLVRQRASHISIESMGKKHFNIEILNQYLKV